MKTANSHKPQTVTSAINWRPMLAAIPVRNRAARFSAKEEGKIRVEAKREKPRYLVPPISWLIKPRDKVILEMQGLGAEILDLCDGHTNVERIVDRFAENHRLTFHEARASVSTYLQLLMTKGVVAMVRPTEAPGEAGRALAL